MSDRDAYQDGREQGWRDKERECEKLRAEIERLRAELKEADRQEQSCECGLTGEGRCPVCLTLAS